MDFEGAKEYILNRFEKELSTDLHYHGLQHTLDVYEACMRFAEKENVIGKQLILLKTAALYHDAGYLVKYKDNEESGVDLVKNILPSFGYSTEEIGIIADMILSTKIPQNPSTLLDKILCDADLDYMGREDFFTTSHKLHREWNDFGYKSSLTEWYKKQRDFIGRHKYFTNAARMMRRKKKFKHLKEIQELVDGLEGNTQFNSIFQNLPIGIYRSTVDGKLLYANKRFVEMLGFDRLEELIDRNLEKQIVVGGYDRERFFKEIKEKGEVENLYSTFYKKDGTKTVLRESAKLLEDQEKKIVFYDAIVQQVSLSSNEMDGVRNYLEDLDIITKTYTRFIPINYLKLLKKRSISEVKAGDLSMQRKTVMCVNIRRIDGEYDSGNPVEDFNFLNSYLKRVLPKIIANKGFVDKVIGDSIISIFSEKTSGALQAAKEIQIDLSRINRFRTYRKMDPLYISIGIHYGDMMIGAIGNDQHMEINIVSDAVNIASRLEGLAVKFGAQAIVTESTLKENNEEIPHHYRYLGLIPIKGQLKSIDLYEVILNPFTDNDYKKMDLRDDFEDAVLLFMAEEYTDALKIFNNIARQNPEDAFVNYYIDECRLKVNKFTLI